MSDKLKNFVTENDAHFDALPSAGHFERFTQKQSLNNDVKSKKPEAISVFYKIAAIFVLVFGIGWLFFNLGKIQGSQEFSNNKISNTVSYTNELDEAELFFTEQVNKKKKEVLAFSTIDSYATKQIMIELDKLELQYLDLKDELAINNDNEQIINAMIENYRMRLSVLERLLKQLKKSNKIKQQHHEIIQA